MRVVPRENEAINEVWLSDRDRFSYEGLTSDDRLTAPKIKVDCEMQLVDRDTPMQAAVDDGIPPVHPRFRGQEVEPAPTPAKTER